MTDAPGTAGPVESVNLAGQLAVIRAALEEGRRPAAGALLGLPELDGDVWVDTAGAAAVTGVPPKTISGWLSRGKPKALPFPSAHRYLYRRYWPLSTLQAWAVEYKEYQRGAREHEEA